MDGPAIITQVTNPKEDEARSPVAGEKGEEGYGQLPRGAMSSPRVAGVLGVRPHGRGGGVYRAKSVRGCGVRLEQREAARVPVPAELL